MYVVRRFQLGRGAREKEMQHDAVRDDVAHSRWQSQMFHRLEH